MEPDSPRPTTSSAPHSPEPLPTSTSSTTTSTIPQKRPHDDTQLSQLPHSQKMPVEMHKPPLKTKPPREKKDSWKKKEAAAAVQQASASAGGGGGGGGPAAGGTGGSGSDQHLGTGASSFQGMPPPALQRWRLPKPQDADYEGARPPVMAPSNVPGADIGCEFLALSEHPKNRRGFRYVPCEASHILPLVSYRMTEVPPFIPRFNFEDMNAQIHVNKTGTVVTTEKGFRMARANVGVREGNWYYECKVLRGIGSSSPDAHTRIGWARREAPLDAPVGFDAYSYSIRDQDGQKVHMSRPTDFFKESITTGDVIGLQIYIPPLHTQRTELLSSLSSNPTSSATAASILSSGDIIRDRIPIRYKNQLYFESFEYQPAKEMEDFMNPSNPSTTSTNNKTSNSNNTHEKLHAAKRLPGSFIRVYKNGKLMGTPWEDLFAFLPPCSKPNSAVGGRELDDGFLGYFPAVSVFRGGAVEVNLGPDFWFPPSDDDRGGAGADAGADAGVDADAGGDTAMRDASGASGEENPPPRPPPSTSTEQGKSPIPELRPVSDRYNEQIAEDIFYDIVDEVDMFFSTDLFGMGGLGLVSGGTSGGGGGGGKVGGDGGRGGGGTFDGAADEEEAGVGVGTDGQGAGARGGTEEIKEMEVEEE